MADIILNPIEEIPKVETVGDQGGVGSILEQPLTGTESKAEQQERKSEMFYQKILSQVKSDQSSAASDVTNPDLDAKAIALLQDVEVQVARLVELAGIRGPVYAVSVARKLDFYVLDQVHDQLTNHFYDTLVAKGLIEKE